MSTKPNQSVCEDAIFEELYNLHSKDLHDYLYYKYGAQYDVDDKVQEAFVKLWKNCLKVTFAKAKSFLFTVANNAVLNTIKHHKVVLQYRTLKHSSTTNESPEFLLEQEEFLIKYQEALARLTDEQRTAFLLNKAEGKKHAEIAEMLGITKKVVEYRVYTAFKKLKEELEGFSLK